MNKAREQAHQLKRNILRRVSSPTVHSSATAAAVAAAATAEGINDNGDNRDGEGLTAPAECATDAHASGVGHNGYGNVKVRRHTTAGPLQVSPAILEDAEECKNDDTTQEDLKDKSRLFTESKRDSLTIDDLGCLKKLSMEQRMMRKAAQEAAANQQIYAESNQQIYAESNQQTKAEWNEVPIPKGASKVMSAAVYPPVTPQSSRSMDTMAEVAASLRPTTTEALVHEMQRRIATLESMLPQGEAPEAAMTPQQKEALLGLSSNFSDLLHSLQDDRACTLLRATSSTKQLLQSVLRPGSARVSSSTSPQSQEPQDFASDLPKELIIDMMHNDHNMSTSAAYLAHTYGGIELPTKLNNRRKKTMKKFAKALTGANTFVRQLNHMSRLTAKDALDYLPMEYTRLGFKEKKRLAKVLSWNGLKKWGFDAFEVEDLSMAPLVRHAPSSFDMSNNASFSLERSRSAPVGKLLNLSDRSSNLSSSLKSNSNKMVSVEEGEEEHFNDGLVLEQALDDSTQNKHIHRCSSGQHEDEEEEAITITQRGCPILLIGWALLASPYAQLAMAEHVNDQELIDEARSAIQKRAERRGRSSTLMNDNIIGNLDETKDDENKSDEDGFMGGYFLPDEFDIMPKSLCQFLRKAENEYSSRHVNPYHNNVHAADVVQSTHALIQMGGADMALVYPPLELFSILLAAVLHDVKHPGTNNNYQVNAQTELSLVYNDTAVLENMHASQASYLLRSGEGGKDGGIFGGMDEDQRKVVRTKMIRSILLTDMSRHFSEVAKMKLLVETVEHEIKDEMREKDAIFSTNTLPFLLRINRDKHTKIRDKLLPFLLHLADIGNPTKTPAVSQAWANCAYDEFFAQGDKESAEGMPVSPLCDRATTDRSEGQIGFINFVVKPAFLLLGRVIPKVDGVVVKQLEENLKFWEKEKFRDKEEKERKERMEKERIMRENSESQDRLDRLRQEESEGEVFRA